MNFRHIKTAIAAGLFILILMPSCQHANKYKSPEIETTSLYRESVPSDTVTIADIPWRDYFADENLVKLIEEGLENNFDLNIATLRIQQAEASLETARAAYFPTISLGAQVSHGLGSNGSDGKSVLGYQSTGYALGINSTWEIDVWGKLSSQKRAKQAQFFNSHVYRNLVQTSLIANIATSYYSLLALDERLRVTNETIELLEESCVTMEALKEAGMQNGAAVEQSKVMLRNTQAGVYDLVAQIHQIENSISLLLGKNPDAITRSSIQNQTVPQEMHYGIPAQMLARRPDVQQAELSFRSAYELTNAAKASFYPAITLNPGSQIGYSSTTLTNFFRPENIIANILGGLTQPIFNKKQLKANLKISKAQQEEALLNFERAVLNAGREVSDILFSFNASVKKNAIRAQQVESSQKSVYYTKKLLEAGEANYLEVLSAEQNLLSSQLSQVQDKLEQLNYSVNLYKALGGGVE